MSNTDPDPEAKLLALRDPPPSEAVVGLCELLLAEARSGYSIEERGVEAHALVGGLERVKMRVLSLDEVG